MPGETASEQGKKAILCFGGNLVTHYIAKSIHINNKIIKRMDNV